jgi:hypothetical protein
MTSNNQKPEANARTGVTAVGSGALLASPRRIQLSRKAGWKIPPNTVVVSRPSKWGNPFTLKNNPRAIAVMRYDTLVSGNSASDFPCIADIQRELRGKNLACWCPLDQPCHADVLLRLANIRS